MSNNNHYRSHTDGRAGFLFLLFLFVASFLQAQVVRKKVTLLMGTRFEFTAVAANDTLVWEAINAGIAEVTRVEKLISEWDSLSPVSEINKNAGIRPVKVNQELFSLIERSGKVNKITGGAFDITWAALWGIWRFDGTMTQIPDTNLIREAVKKVGHDLIVLNRDSLTVFLPQKGMKMGFGGIGQGYGVQCAVRVMKNLGIESGVVNASGDIYAFGTRPDGQAWKISIADPRNPEVAIAWLEAKDMAVVTSGSYFKFAEINGVRYSHILHPRTGWPATGLISATVICPDTEIADALATGIFVLGREEGLRLINQLKGIECILMDESGEIIVSDGLKLNYYREQPLPPGEETIRNTR